MLQTNHMDVNKMMDKFYIVMIIIVIIVCSGCAKQSVNTACLSSKSDLYCKDHGWTIGTYYGSNVMNCLSLVSDDRNPEFGKVTNFTSFRFLETEMEECK